MKTFVRLAFASLLLAAAPAFAQTLTFPAGANIQICDSAAAGAQCHPAVSPQELPPGSHMMVGPDSSATLTYPNGATVEFTEPGLYTINAAPAGALVASEPTTLGSIMASYPGFIAFSALIVASGVASSVGDDENLLEPFSP